MKVLLPLLLLAGCVPSMTYPYVTLIDQRSFIRTGQAPAATEVRGLPALPLATIRFDQPNLDYAPDLARAIDLAQVQRPEVEFNVVTPVARGAAPSAQATQDAADVARAIAEDLVPADRIHVGLVEDPGAPLREVRVYVR